MAIVVSQAPDLCEKIVIPLHQFSVLKGSSQAEESAFLFFLLSGESQKRVHSLFDFACPTHNPFSTARAVSPVTISGLPPVVSIRRTRSITTKDSLLDYLGLRSSLVHWIEHQTTNSLSRQNLENFLKKRLGTYLSISGLLNSSALEEQLSKLLQQGFHWAIHNGKLYDLEDDSLLLENTPQTHIPIVLDRFKVGSSSLKRCLSLLLDAHKLGFERVVIHSLERSSDEWSCTPSAISQEQSYIQDDYPLSFPPLLAEAKREDLAEEVRKYSQINIEHLLTELDANNFDLGESLRGLLLLGLGHLTLARQAHTLSLGEARRIAFFKAQSLAIKSMLFTIEYPSFGLHPHDQRSALRSIQALCEKKHTVIATDTQRTILNAAQNQVNIKAFNQNSQTPTPSPIVCTAPASNKISFTNLSYGNLKNISVSIPQGQITAITGISGAGKTSLLFHQILERIIENPSLYGFKGTVQLQTSSIRPRAHTMLCSYLNFYKPLTKFYCQLEAARIRGYTQRHFSLSPGKDSFVCAECRGSGSLLGQDLLASCSKCSGRGFSKEIEKVKHQNRTLLSTLSQSVHENSPLLSLFRECKNTLHYLKQLNLTHLSLNRLINTLSIGELQRVALIRALVQKQSASLFFAFDEPCSGLPDEDAFAVLQVLRELTKSGHTVCLIEHNLNILTGCDHIIDLGPEAGAQGGEVVFQGTPKQMIEEGKGYSADCLRSIIRNEV